MPIYEYTCQGCGTPFEILIRGTERPQCPQCGSVKLDRRLSVPAAHTHASNSLSVCEVPRGGGETCGLPQCGLGGCQGL